MNKYKSSPAEKAPRPLHELATPSAVRKYLETWESDRYRDVPGFLFCDKKYNSYAIMLDRQTTVGVLEKIKVPEHLNRKLRALDCLVMLFQSMLFNKSLYRLSRGAFLQVVSSNVELSERVCQRLEEWYVSARRSFLKESETFQRPGSTLTDFVDRWISFLDTAPSRQATSSQHYALPATQAPPSVRSAPITPIKPPPPARPAYALSTPTQRKGRAHAPEPDSAERLYISIEDDEPLPNPAESLDTGHKKKRKRRSARSPSSDEVTSEAEEESKPKSHKKRKTSVQSPMSVSSPTTPVIPASKRKSTSDNSESLDTALEKLKNRVDKRHSRYKEKHEKLKSRTVAQKQRVDDLEGKAENQATKTDKALNHLSDDIAEQKSRNTSQTKHIDKLEAKIENQATQTDTALDRFSDDLAEQKQLLRLIQASTTGMAGRLEEKGDIFQHLLEKLKDLVKDKVRHTWQGAALELSSKTRDIDVALKDHDNRLDSLGKRIDQQNSDRFNHVLRSGTRYELELRPKVEKLDSRVGDIEAQGKRVLALEQTIERCEAFARGMARKMEESMAVDPERHATEVGMLRSTVAAQANTIGQLEKQMRALAEQMSELSKNRSKAQPKGLWLPRG